MNTQALGVVTLKDGRTITLREPTTEAWFARVQDTVKYPIVAWTLVALCCDIPESDIGKLGVGDYAKLAAAAEPVLVELRNLFVLMIGTSNDDQPNRKQH